MKFVCSFRLRNWKEHVFPQFKHVINGLTYPGSIMTQPAARSQNGGALSQKFLAGGGFIGVIGVL